MAKSKNNKAKQATLLSPEKYIQTKARNLPIKECWVTKDYKGLGIAHVIVTRQHTSGNLTFGNYMVDTFCLGVKNAMYKYNMPDYEYEDMIEYINSCEELAQITYEEAHNLIFGAIEYAEDLGIAPHKDFKLAQYLLEEDTDDIPLIEMEFGRDGKPHLVVNTRLEASRYTPALGKHAKGEYSVYIREEEDDFDDFDYMDEDPEDLDKDKDFDEEMFTETLEALMEYTNSATNLSYTYQRPDYPTELKLNHSELEILYNTEDRLPLEKETIAQLLQLPRESLIDDLIHITYVELGRTAGKTSHELFEQEYISPLKHTLLLLGELKAERSLQAVLEVVRQDMEFYKFHFEDEFEDILPLTLYYIGRNQLPELMDYAKETGLCPLMHFCAGSAASYIAIHEKERREEVVEWFRELLSFHYKNFNNPLQYDLATINHLFFCILDTGLKELVPDVEKHLQEDHPNSFFIKTGLLEKLQTGYCDSIHDYSLFDIYERYEYCF